MTDQKCRHNTITMATTTASPMSGRDDELARVLSVLAAVDADVQFRARITKAKCNAMVEVLKYVDHVDETRAKVQEAAARRQEATRAHATSVESSITAAIHRARRIRQEMSTLTTGGISQGGDDDDNDDDVPPTHQPPPRPLDEILAQAAAIRDQQPTRTATSTPVQTVPDVVAVAPPPAATNTSTRLEFPRRWKTVLDQLEEQKIADVEQPFRSIFCRKMTELVSLADRRAAVDSATNLRVQVPYPVQRVRLRRAYQRLSEYMLMKANADSEAVQRALTAPSISTVYPVYCRLKQATTVLGELNDVATQVTASLPPRPSLSQAAINHRDAYLSRLRRRSGTTKSSTATASPSNRMLTESPDTSHLQTHRDVLDKLQSAWDRQDGGQRDSTRFYDLALQETILSQTSNLVLSAFQHTFCDGAHAPVHSEVLALLRVIRVAESAAVFQGRRQRSAVQR